MKLGEKIKLLRNEYNYTMQELADKSNLTKGYISMLEKGINPTTKKEIIPSLDTVQNIAVAFNIDLETLLTDVYSNVQLPKPTPSLPSTVQQIVDTTKQLQPPRQDNVLQYAKTQLKEQNSTVIPFPDTLQEESEEYVTVGLYGKVSAGRGLDLYDEVIEEIQYPKPVPTHDIALQVHGDSMEPMFRDEEIIFVRKSYEINQGQIGVFIVNGQGFLKKFYRDADGLRLVSLNKNYTDILLQEFDEVKLVGVVVM